MSRFGTPLQRVRERARRSVAPSRIAYFQQRGLEQAVEEVEIAAAVADGKAVAAGAAAAEAQETVDGALDGTEQFTALNVGGTDVKPFLDKTDGDALVDASGLGAAVVETAAIETTAIRPSPPYTNASAVSVGGLSTWGGDVNAAGATTVLSTSFTLTATEEVTIAFQASGDFTNAETSELALFIDYAGIHSMQAIRNVEASHPSQYRELREPNASGGVTSVVITAVQTLAAGSHTILVLAMGENPGELNIPAGAATVEVYVR